MIVTHPACSTSRTAWVSASTEPSAANATRDRLPGPTTGTPSRRRSYETLVSIGVLSIGLPWAPERSTSVWSTRGRASKPRGTSSRPAARRKAWSPLSTSVA
jgi:hypothetical protein